MHDSRDGYFGIEKICDELYNHHHHHSAIAPAAMQGRCRHLSHARPRFRRKDANGYSVPLNSMSYLCSERSAASRASLCSPAEKYEPVIYGNDETLIAWNARLRDLVIPCGKTVVRRHVCHESHAAWRTRDSPHGGQV